MSRKKPNALVDTSAVLAAMQRSTPRHISAFQKITDGHRFFSSAYVRMESIRRWICSYIRAAIVIEMYGNVSDALNHLEQDFSIRDVKASINALSEILRKNGTINNSALAAEELGRIAVYWLCEFDDLFGSRIPNRCKCSKGTENLSVDFDSLLEDLHAFYESFTDPVSNCEINAYLKSQAIRRKVDLVTENQQTSTLDVVKNAASFREKDKWITCKECSKIGDLVIALETPPATSVIHVDNSFRALCPVLKKRSIPVPSQRAAEKAGSAQ